MPQQRKKELAPLPGKIVGTVGSRLRNYRKLRAKTQKEVADEIGISKELVSIYEAGKLHLNDEMLTRFALTLRTSSDNLLGIGEIKTDSTTPSVRLMRRMKQIEKLSPNEQKALLRILDGYLKSTKIEYYNDQLLFKQSENISNVTK